MLDRPAVNNAGSGVASARPVPVTVSTVSSRSTPRGSGAAGVQAARPSRGVRNRAGFMAILLGRFWCRSWRDVRSEEHTSELQSLMRTSYAVFCLKKKQSKQDRTTQDKRLDT